MSIRKGKEIYDAVERNDIKELKELINKKDAYLYYHNARNMRTTALHIAVSKNNIECVEILIQKGYNLEVKAYLGLTPLHFAVLSDNFNIYTYLINMGADINATADNGFTSIDICVENNNFRNLYFLLSYGAKMTERIIDISAENNTMKNTLAMLIVNNYDMFKRIRCSDHDKLDLIDFSRKILQEVQYNFNKTTLYFKKKVNILNVKNPFKFINSHEKTKPIYINNIYNESTYQQTYKYNKAMINIITKALSIGTEHMILSCLEARTHRKKDTKFKCKQYATIMCIGKIGELINKKKYYEEQLQKLYLNVQNKRTIIKDIDLYLDKEKPKLPYHPI